MGSLVGVLFCAYTVAKVVRDAAFLGEFDALALPYAYVGVALTSVLYVWMEGRALRRFTRVGAGRLNQYLAIAFSILAAVVYPISHYWTAVAFYLWTGSQAMILLPHFWVLALDVWDSRRARRLFPLFSACGLIGGLLGGSIAGWLTPVVKGRGGLMWVLAGLLIVGHLLTRTVETRRVHRPSPFETMAAVSRWRILRSSGYVRILAAALALSVIVATLVDFQFKYFAQYAFPDPHDLTQFLGKFQVALNGMALIFQFGAAGWLLRRLDLGTSTALQPLAVMAFGSWAAMAPHGRPIVLMRGVQGVFSQVLGKSSAEIYYLAVRPPERRRIKPAIDTLAERWSDAVVGVLLILVLGVIGVPFPLLATITVALAALWLVVLLLLNRQFRAAIQKALGKRWVDPEAVADSVRTPAARAPLVQALRAGEERRIVFALRLSRYADHPEILQAVRDCLEQPSAAVRAAAVEAMEAMGLRDDKGRIEGFLTDADEGVRRAAVRYLLTMSREPTAFVRSVLEAPDPSLRAFALDALFDRPHEAPAAIPPQWIDARIAAGTREDLVLAARALGTLTGKASTEALRNLITHPDPDVSRAALLSAARRPSRPLLDAILPLLLVPDRSYEVRQALAAIGDPAVPSLTRLLSGESGGAAQTLAARTLAQISSPRAVDALVTLVRSNDRILRQLGLRNLSRVRVQRGEPVLPRAVAHRLFLRELREYRLWLAPAVRLESDAIPDVRLLAESYREFAEMALERGVHALASWYPPRALFGAFERLRSREPGAAAPALEYLSSVLPRSVYRHMRKTFEDSRPDGGATGPLELAEWIRAAWQSGDAWLKACAVRASRYVPELKAELFTVGPDDGDVVRAEVEARSQGAVQTLVPALATRTATR